MGDKKRKKAQFLPCSCGAAGKSDYQRNRGLNTTTIIRLRDFLAYGHGLCDDDVDSASFGEFEGLRFDSTSSNIIRRSFNELQSTLALLQVTAHRGGAMRMFEQKKLAVVDTSKKVSLSNSS